MASKIIICDPSLKEPRPSWAEKEKRAKEDYQHRLDELRLEAMSSGMFVDFSDTITDIELMLKYGD